MQQTIGEGYFPDEIFVIVPLEGYDKGFKSGFVTVPVFDCC